MDKLIITAALLGAGTTKAQTPHVPITPDEIVADSIECVKAGASCLHLHARDKDGVNSMETEIFVEIVTKLRAKLKEEGLDAVINLTTSGSKFSDELRLAHLP